VQLPPLKNETGFDCNPIAVVHEKQGIIPVYESGIPLIIEVDHPERTPSLTPGDGDHFDEVLGYQHTGLKPNL
jgi:hypothetical protein